VARALWQRLDNRRRPPPRLPGPELLARVQPPPAGLIRDYVRHVGGDPAAYGRGEAALLPPHMFPQWSFPLAARALHGIPYPLLRVVNGGCRLEVRAPLPAGAPLTVRARLVGVEDDGRRAVLHQRLVSETESRPGALAADVYAVVPSGAGDRRGGEGRVRARREAPTIPAGAREIAAFDIGSDAGLAFALLTGDFNPVHWLRPYARAFGFGGPILHGFAMMARVLEALARTRFGGDVHRIAVLDVRFARPLPLGTAAHLYLDRDGRSIYLGDGPEGRAYLAGSFEERNDA
jgi:acyl dehydratase